MYPLWAFPDVCMCIRIYWARTCAASLKRSNCCCVVPVQENLCAACHLLIVHHPFAGTFFVCMRVCRQTAPAFRASMRLLVPVPLLVAHMMHDCGAWLLEPTQWLRAAFVFASRAHLHWLHSKMWHRMVMPFGYRLLKVCHMPPMPLHTMPHTLLGR